MAEEGCTNEPMAFSNEPLAEEFTNEPMGFSNEPSGPSFEGPPQSGDMDKVINKFRQFDLNGDAMISKQELKQVLQELAPQYWTDEKVDRLFCAANIDKDDHISYAEFAEYIFAVVEKPPSGPEESPSNMEQLFPFLDKLVGITQDGMFEGEYLYATQHNDGHGRRYVHTWMKGGSPEEDRQAHWKIARSSNGYFIITHAVYTGEYLYATQHTDGHGRRYVHTWMDGGSPEEDRQAHWKIMQNSSGNYIIKHAVYEGRTAGEKMYATRHSDGNGRRHVHTWMRDWEGWEEPQSYWKITPMSN